jgi:hypothetical protein
VAIEAHGDPSEIEASVFPVLAGDFAFRANLAKLALKNRKALAAQRAKKKPKRRKQ